METSINCLVNKSCVPCQGSVPPLTIEVASKLLAYLAKRWTLNKAGHLYKEFLFNDFKEAMIFANNVAELAEKEAHHPNLKISWGLCAIEIWTHKISGLTESDFILAAKIEAIHDTR